MNFIEAVELVLIEAQSSALGDNNQEVLDAVEVVEQFTKYLPKEFTDETPNMIKTTAYTDFCDDAEKMLDFVKLNKNDFLSSYSYITELEYNITRSKYRENEI
tara:strand:+ start:290 stop:598 length:309 start_codon:yes stop_codon:yes gene_type:complete